MGEMQRRLASGIIQPEHFVGGFAHTRFQFLNSRSGILEDGFFLQAVGLLGATELVAAIMSQGGVVGWL